jgi:hypothetical protein
LNYIKNMNDNNQHETLVQRYWLAWCKIDSQRCNRKHVVNQWFENVKTNLNGGDGGGTSMLGDLEIKLFCNIYNVCVQVYRTHIRKNNSIILIE